ncbi:MAG TPA: hypothetical protein PLL54_00185 [Dermatophilaceae bacterium]|nr:hypothetical protein [Dermatophilaceae bacterium]
MKLPFRRDKGTDPQTGNDSKEGGGRRTTPLPDIHPVYSGFDDPRAATIRTPNVFRNLDFPASMSDVVSIELESEVARRVTELAESGALDDAAYTAIDTFLGAVLAQQCERIEHHVLKQQDVLEVLRHQISANLDQTLSELDAIGRDLDIIDAAFRDSRNALLNTTITPSWRTPIHELTSANYELKGATAGEQAHLQHPGANR